MRVTAGATNMSRLRALAPVRSVSRLIRTAPTRMAGKAHCSRKRLPSRRRNQPNTHSPNASMAHSPMAIRGTKGALVSGENVPRSMKNARAN